MQRVVSLFLPNWPTDRLCRALGESAPPAEAKLLLVARRIITAANPAAQQAGLCAGMKLARAQALVPDLLCLPADPAADAVALEQLALWALQRYAPIVALDAPDGLSIDITGAAHLHGGEAALLADLCRRLAGCGITARAALADTAAAAHALARYQAATQLVVPSGETGTALLPLPLASLRLPAETLTALRAMGFYRIGDLAQQPRAPLVRRFGQCLIDRLDLAFGRIQAPIQPIRPPDLLTGEQNFIDPIASPEALALHIGFLVARLCGQLETSGLGARRLDLRFHRVDGEVAVLHIGTARPNRNAPRLTRLLTERLEQIDPGLGVETLCLIATLAEPLLPVQTASTLIEAAKPDLSSLIDTLSNRLGAEHVYRMAPVESDVPERSQRRIAANAPQTGQGWQTGWPRPANLLPRPEPIKTVALLPDNPPVSFTWRGVRRRVWRADGPERIFGEWWKRDAERAAVRDYFRVEDESGARYWIYRAGDGENTDTGSHAWFLHGLFG